VTTNENRFIRDVAELTAFIQIHQKGECRTFSHNSSSVKCRCPFCLVDNLYGELLEAQEKVDKFQDTIEIMREIVGEYPEVK